MMLFEVIKSARTYQPNTHRARTLIAFYTAQSGWLCGKEIKALSNEFCLANPSLLMDQLQSKGHTSPHKIRAFLNIRTPFQRVKGTGVPAWNIVTYGFGEQFSARIRRRIDLRFLVLWATGCCEAFYRAHGSAQRAVDFVLRWRTDSAQPR